MKSFAIAFAIYWAAGILLALAVARWKDHDGKIRGVLLNHPPAYAAGWLIVTALFVVPALMLNVISRPLIWFGWAAQWLLRSEKSLEPPLCTCAHPRFRHGTPDLALYCREPGCTCNLYQAAKDPPDPGPVEPFKVPELVKYACADCDHLFVAHAYRDSGWTRECEQCSCMNYRGLFPPDSPKPVPKETGERLSGVRFVPRKHMRSRPN